MELIKCYLEDSLFQCHYSQMEYFHFSIHLSLENLYILIFCASVNFISKINAYT